MPELEDGDALRIMRSRDTDQTLYYCHPPYVGTDQGHYDGYSKDDYEQLLSELAQIEGKFLLSSYRSSESLDRAVAEHGWNSVEIKMPKAVSKGKIKMRY